MLGRPGRAPGPEVAALQAALPEQLCCAQEEKQPLKEGVQDMLVKHHLFSWDIDG